MHKNKIFKLLFASIFLSFTTPLFSQLQIKTVLPANTANGNLTNTINPDACNLRIGKIGGRWNNTVGAEIGVIQLKNRSFTLGTNMGGFINMHDYSNDQAFSWQIWRGCIKFSSFLRFPRLDSLLGKGSKMVIENTWAHESQHATDLIGYTYYFTYWNPYNFPNGSIRSFHYWRPVIYYIKNIDPHWQLDISAGYKYFYAPKIEDAYKMLNHSGFTEAGIQYNIKPRFSVYLKAYYESINNNFDSKQYRYRYAWNKQPFQYRIAEIGLFKGNENGQKINPYLMYSYSNGRGLDFPEVTKFIGFGLRVSL